MKKSRIDRGALYAPANPVKLLRPKTENQAKLIQATYKSSIIFANGPAGTGKTYVAGARAIDMLQSGQINQMILTRPYIPAGEKYGHLPGTIDEKFLPYLQPYLQVFHDRIGKAETNKMLLDGRIQVIPIGFLQGLTFNNSVILIDEAENCTLLQIELICTRIGMETIAMFTGDQNQSYIPNSGFTDAIRILNGLPVVDIITFGIDDVVRSETCKLVLEAFDKEKCKRVGLC